ncbi:MAG: hypothetical protein IPP22_16760 [Nitrosomonas sp.]|nr:hypothetical protein [Nitrosomonas sp.]
MVESFRIGNKVKQQTLLNLGAEFSIPREYWGELTNRIEPSCITSPIYFRLTKPLKLRRSA